MGNKDNGRKRSDAIGKTEKLRGKDTAPATKSMPAATERIKDDDQPGQTELLDKADHPSGEDSRGLAQTRPLDPGEEHPAREPESGTQDSLKVGSVLRDRFRITGILGSGGMGTVYQATDLLKEEAHDEQTAVALKVLKPDFADAELSFMTLQREARRAQQLAHPNIVTVYDFDRADGVIYMTMEYMDGKPLDALLEAHPDGLEPEHARRIARHVTEGLAYAHKCGIVHSDLKPENVFILEEGRAKILDFGIARAWQSSHRDLVEEIVRGCTPTYATPELLARHKPTPSDDVYALGCVLYETFTGRHPFDYASGAVAKEKGLRPQRSSAFRRAEWKAISSALSLDAKRRPSDAEQFRKRFFPSPVRKTALAVSTLAVAGTVAYTLLYEPEPGPDVPFDALPMETQQRVTENLADASLFLEQGDLNTALQLYDAVLRAHPGNRDAVRGMNHTANQIIERVQTAHTRGELPDDSAHRALESLLAYATLPGKSRDATHDALERLR